MMWVQGARRDAGRGCPRDELVRGLRHGLCAGDARRGLRPRQGQGPDPGGRRHQHWEERLLDPVLQGRLRSNVCRRPARFTPIDVPYHVSEVIAQQQDWPVTPRATTSLAVWPYAACHSPLPPRCRYEKTTDFKLQSRVVLVDGVEICFEIWEIGDVHRHRMGIFHRLRHCDAVVCTFDPRDALTTQHCKDWIEFVSKFRDRGNLVRAMVATGVDRKEPTALSREARAEIAAQCRASYHECSAATGVGIDAVIYAIARKVGQVGPEHIRELFARHTRRRGADRHDSCSIQ